MISFPNEDAKWTWLAAVIDGEGCLFLGKSKGKRLGLPKYKRGFGWQPFLEITNKSQAFLETAHSICEHGTMHSIGPSRPDVFRLRIASDGIRFILSRILPYLIVKRQQALLLLEALQLLEKQTGNRRYNRKYYGTRSPFDSRLEEIYQEIRNLNKKSKRR